MVSLLCYFASFEESLILSGNLLGYTIPEWIGDLSKLKLLALDGNVFTGTVPASLGSLSTLGKQR